MWSGYRMRIGGKRGVAWGHQESITLLEIWQDEKIQHELNSSPNSNIDIYREIADQLCESYPGFDRRGEDVRARIKRLKRAYFAYKKMLTKPGGQRVKQPVGFEIMDRVLGRQSMREQTAQDQSLLDDSGTRVDEGDEASGEEVVKTEKTSNTGEYGSSSSNSHQSFGCPSASTITHQTSSSPSLSTGIHQNGVCSSVSTSIHHGNICPSTFPIAHLTRSSRKRKIDHHECSLENELMRHELERVVLEKEKLRQEIELIKFQKETLLAQKDAAEWQINVAKRQIEATDALSLIQGQVAIVTKQE